ncbi:hypothetical protein D9756_008861 [Leucocoprinus leucothites]|uniref:Uncharacterized protein n=1 Tax=Leucocoprinus leucothites TaxID=201217 RepID=A0A8H5CXS9_9AGAR|nr:hypothetical protein D9756_008861 [Leucoagaricus leucothites]
MSYRDYYRYGGLLSFFGFSRWILDGPALLRDNKQYQGHLENLRQCAQPALREIVALAQKENPKDFFAHICSFRGRFGSVNENLCENWNEIPAWVYPPLLCHSPTPHDIFHLDGWIVSGCSMLAFVFGPHNYCVSARMHTGRNLVKPNYQSWMDGVHGAKKLARIRPIAVRIDDTNIYLPHDSCYNTHIFTTVHPELHQHFGPGTLDVDLLIVMRYYIDNEFEERKAILKALEDMHDDDFVTIIII